MCRSPKLVTARKYNAWFSNGPYQFDTKLCDESHVLRDPKSGRSRAILIVPARGTILMTATPTLNCIEDIFGTALQVWRSAGFFDFTQAVVRLR